MTPDRKSMKAGKLCNKNQLTILALRAAAILQLVELRSATGVENNDKNKTSNAPVLVIGAGVAGLAAAHFLTNYGFAVRVFEAND
jgi:NADPH-dependent 2,4-dienoyl-CoA reductase/sulfur reductase-like enzyme